MSSVQIIVGSMLGGTEYVAEACEQTLLSLDHQTMIHLSPNFDDILTDNQIWLICTSTHGAGDYPDNIKSFITDLEQSTKDLSTTKFAIIGVGDSNYDTFCFAAKNLQNLLLTKGCKKILALKTFDIQENIDPETMAQEWLIKNKDQLSLG